MKNFSVNLFCFALIACVSVNCQDQETQYVSNKVLKGNNLNIQGSNNDITGDYAQVNGGNNKVSGDYARVIGGNAVIIGDNSIVTGSNAVVRNGVKSSRVTGDNAEVYSKNAFVEGNNAKVEGDYGTVRGNNADVNGDRANVTGRNPTVNGKDGLICSEVGNNVEVTGDNVVIKVVYIYTDGRKSIRDTNPNAFNNVVRANGARARIVSSDAHCVGMFRPSGYNYDMGITGKNLVVRVGGEVVSGDKVEKQGNTIDFTGKYNSSVGVNCSVFTVMAAMCVLLFGRLGQ